MAKNFRIPFLSRAGTRDDTRSTYWVTPWKARTSDGLYVGHNGEVWMYRQLVLSPMMWEDPQTRLRVASPLENALYALAATSSDRGLAMQSLTRSREVHILAVTWETPATPPEGTPARLDEFLRPVLNFTAPQKALLLGVKLWPKVVQTGSGLKESISKLADRVAMDGPLDLSAYEADIRTVSDILNRNGAGIVPDRTVRSQLESWFNRGRGAHVTVYEQEQNIVVDNFERIEMASLEEFEVEEFFAPNAPWAMSAQTHPAGANLISIRGQLDPPAVGRNRLRRSERKIRAQMDEEAKTGDLDRPELSQKLHAAEAAERFVMSGREPLVSNCSIQFARRVGGDVVETYMDELSELFGISVIPLPHRQLDALDETLPTSSKRVNPFLQDVSIAMLAHAGLQAYSNLGDGIGLLTGVVDPDGALCYLNPAAAPAQDKAPMTIIAGRPGSGKTFLASLLAVQAAIAGQQVVFINPKGNDSLSGIAELTGGRIVRFTEIEEEGGYFDPFSFCADPHIAASIAQNHILTVLGSRGGYKTGFTGEQELAVISGLRDAADAGVGCVGDALPYIEQYDPKVAVTIRQMSRDPLFRLGIGLTPRPRPIADRSLVLIEFDRALALPNTSNPADYGLNERLAISAIQLVSRAASELLANAGGGMLVIDEAWMFLKSSEGASALDALGRLGRSQNILPILITQKVRDFIDSGVDLEDLISRVFAMALNDRSEAEAALSLCGLEATPERIQFLRDAGPQRPEPGKPGHPAMSLHRDLNDRHAAVMIGPWPDWLREQLSTNPIDRAARAAASAATAPPAQPAPAPPVPQPQSAAPTPQAPAPQPAPQPQSAPPAAPPAPPAPQPPQGAPVQSPGGTWHKLPGT